MAMGISLHIGLNRVDPEHYRGWDGTLRGCEHDAQDMSRLAGSLGYSTSLLLTADATVARVTGAIDAAAKALGPGDIFFVTYSGHGGQVPDTNGDERQATTDEVGAFPDRYDETWVLFDRMLVDDELFELWSRFAPMARIVMLSDSCHSGTVAKAAPWEDDPDDDEPNRRIPIDVEERVYEAHRAQYDDVQAVVPTRTASSIQATVALVSGCMDNQESADGRTNGRFTARLLDVWDEGRFTGSLAALHEAILGGMPPTQTPNLYVVGPASRRGDDGPALRI